MNNDHDHALPDELRRSLQALRRDATPARDLWPGIRARIEDAQPAPPPAAATPLPVHARSGRNRRTRRLAGLATAASLAAALAIAWTVAPPSAPEPEPRREVAASLILQEAAHMTDEYRTAWSAFDARRPAGVDASALHEIDRGAAAVRAALRQDPDARYLFDRLQSLYAQRLDLSRRLSTSTLST